MNSLIVPIQWLPKDSEARKEHVNFLLEYHGFDLSRPYNEHCAEGAEEIIYSQELAPLDRVTITGKLVL